MGASTTAPPSPSSTRQADSPFAAGCMSLAPMDDSPMASDSVRERNSSETAARSHSARAPMNSCALTATSTNAISRTAPSTRTSSMGDCGATATASTAPDATTPAAMPATVPSTICGNTLFVPVDIGINGTCPDPLATARLVPSPPKVTMQPAPISRIASAARVESSSLDVMRMSTNAASTVCPPPSILARARPSMSGMKTTCRTPADSSPASTLRRMLTFS